MDRRRTYGILIATVMLAASVRSAGLPLTEARWIAPGRDVVAALTIEPDECLDLPADPEQKLLVEIGRAAFRDPLILGGLAARTGLTCASCHPGGQANPDFHFPGLSGAPGTADTTSAVTSERRDDGQFNPRPIPSLVTGHGQETVSRSDNGALEQFIHGIVIDEFNGVALPHRVLNGLAAYVRALRAEACPITRQRPITLAARIDDAARALSASAQAIDRSDPATAKVMLASARSILGSAVERLPTSNRAEFVEIGIEIGRLQQQELSSAALETLRERLSALHGKAERWQHGSLFDPKKISHMLQQH